MCKLLIAEDDMVFAKLLEKSLAGKNVEVIVVNDGGKAIECLQKESIDYAIVDIAMQEVSGIGVLNIINKKHLKTKLAIMTEMEEGNDLSQFLVKISKNKRSPLKQVLFRDCESDIIAKCKSFIHEEALA